MLKPGTRVLWEEASPRPYFPDVLKEVRVVDPSRFEGCHTIGYIREVPKGYSLVTESPNAIIKRSDCSLVSDRRLVY